MPLCYQRADAFCFPSPLVPAVTELLHPIDVGRKEFLHFARFFFPYCSVRLGSHLMPAAYLRAPSSSKTSSRLFAKRPEPFTC
jgi:hypothetical protein